ncbi:MAG: DNA polymerase III subunit chi [Pseudomonadota bacterium]
MGAVLFYHLTRDSIAQTLGQLLPKALAAGMRIELRGREMAALERLDQQLWQGPEEGFLPHGLAGGPHDALQPVLLTLSDTLQESTTCLMSLEGAPIAADEVAGLTRSCVLFEGGSPDAVDHARGQWRALTEAGCAAEYWSQENGPWEKKAESAGS